MVAQQIDDRQQDHRPHRVGCEIPAGDREQGGTEKQSVESRNRNVSALNIRQKSDIDGDHS